MPSLRNKVPSPAMIVAIIALIASLGGTAWAASQISGKLIKKNSIPANRLKKKSVTGAQIKSNSLTGAQINLSSLGKVPTATSADRASSAASADALANLSVLPMKKVGATDGASAAAARSAAPENALYSKGPFTVYAKCFHDTSANKVYAEVYINTSASGSIFYSDDGVILGSGGTFLDPGTVETNRLLSDGDGGATANSTTAEDADYTPFWAMAPDGTTLQGATWEAAKNGTLPGGSQGVYGAGNVCLFTGRSFNS